VKRRLDIILIAAAALTFALTTSAGGRADGAQPRVPTAPVALYAVPGPEPVSEPSSAGRRTRPSDVLPSAASVETAPSDLAILNDYDLPERTFSAREVVVHYVTRGINAPPLNDDDGNGVPDYVERAAAAADMAVEYYDRRGFRRIAADAGGPDERPDLYVSRFAPGTFGVAFPAADSVDGAFAAVANDLDPSSTASLASLAGTVAHELFHLVQFSYFRRDEEPIIPAWALEGSAAAMERRVLPELADIVSALQLRRWFAAPNRSIATQSYGSQLLWERLDRLAPRLLPAYLERLGAKPVEDAGRAAFVATFARVAKRPFAPVFHRFVLSVADEHGTRIRPVAILGPRAGRVSAVAPFAVHYVRLRVPRRGRFEVEITLAQARDAAGATLTYGMESDSAGRPADQRRVAPSVSHGGRTLTFRIPAAARRSERFVSPQLVISNGAPERAVRYRVTSR
jgi:hypothetical protein